MKPATLLLFLASMQVAAIDIITKEGTIYQNAEIITVTPAGLDIMFTNSKGLPVLKGIEFNNLPEDLRQQYMKNPAQSEDYQREVNRFSTGSLNDIIGDRQREIIRAKQQKQNSNMVKTQKLLEHAIFAHRLGGEFRVINNITSGSIALPANITAGEKPDVKSGLIFVYGLIEKPDFLAQGFIYPTGIKVNTAECIGLPVYAISAERAAEILSFYLNIQTDYTLKGEKVKQQPNETESAPLPQNRIEQLLFSSDATFYVSERYPDWYINYCRQLLSPKTETRTTAETSPPPLRIIDPRRPMITPDSFSSRYRDPFHPYGCPGANTGFFNMR